MPFGFFSPHAIEIDVRSGVRDLFAKKESGEIARLLGDLLGEAERGSGFGRELPLQFLLRKRFCISQKRFGRLERYIGYMALEIHDENVTWRYSNGIALRTDVSIAIPALNEESTIREVVERCLALPLETQVIVVNDGSEDKTLEILQSFGDKITLLTNPKPSGKGNAIVQALAHAQGVATIVQDADLEYTPEQIPALIQPILDRKANVVYGTRFAHGYAKGMALPNKIVNKMLAWSVGILFFRSISDEATCYKAFRTDLLQAFDLQCRRFEFCPEATAKALRCNQKIMEIPIDYEPRSKEAGKKIRWYDAPEAFWTLFRYRFWNPVKAKSTLDRPGPEKPTSSEPN